MIPVHINIVIEDDLSEVVLRTVLNQVDRKYVVSHCFPDTARDTASRGVGYIKKKIDGFNNAAKGIPFLVLRDLDNEECAPILLDKWLPDPKHPNLIVRIAVREVESWVMAHREAFAKFLGINQKEIPLDLDGSIDDPKKFLIRLARRSRRKSIKEAIVPRPGSTAIVGPDYNGTLINFVQNHWKLHEAVKHSDSLKRTLLALKHFRPV